MFGLGVDQQRRITVVPPIELELRGGQVVFVTGASGGGKSTLLRLVREQLQASRRRIPVIDFHQLTPPADRPLVDCFEAPLESTVRWLSLAGLNDAFVMLRRPGELSDGQRYRLRLAQTLAAIDRPGGESGQVELTVVMADEFAATLDRQTARIIARNIRKAMTRLARQDRPVCFIAVTSHDDLLESLDPDTLIVQEPGERLQLLQRDSPGIQAAENPPADSIPSSMDSRSHAIDQ